MATENSILSHLRQRLIWTQCEIESLCEGLFISIPLVGLKLQRP